MKEVELEQEANRFAEGFVTQHKRGDVFTVHAPYAQHVPSQPGAYSNEAFEMGQNYSVYV